MKKNDRKKVARLTTQATNPGTATPRGARPLEVEVVSVLSAASPVGSLVEVNVGVAAPPPVPVLAVVKISGSVEVGATKLQNLRKRRMTGSNIRIITHP